MDRGFLCLANLCISRLLHTVVQKGVRCGGHHGGGVATGEKQPFIDGRLQVRSRGFRCLLTDTGQGLQIKAVAHTGRHDDGVLCTRAKTLNPPAHEIDDVIGDGRLGNGRHIVNPAASLIVEGDEAFLMKRLEELDHKEGIAVRFALEKLGERSRVGEVAVQRIPHEVGQIVKFQRRQGDVIKLCAGLGKRGLDLEQRMVGMDLIVTVGADEEQTAQVWIGQERRQERQGGRIDPLQVIEKHHQWMLWRREDRDKVLYDHDEAMLRFGRAERWHWRLFAQEQLDLG